MKANAPHRNWVLGVVGCLLALGAMSCAATTPQGTLPESEVSTHGQPAVAEATPAPAAAEPAKNPWRLDRTVLPIHAPERPTYSQLDVREVPKPDRFDVTAPAGAPNVVVILLDDVGFGVTGTFGGPVQTPSLDKLASEGLRYTNFHTTALCSPTRNALKTGRNHHVAESGAITEIGTSFPGNTGQLPDSVAPLAEIVRLNGYNTAAFGKWHETAVWETSVSGPSDRWPLMQGFDHFYGFIGGETNQWAPGIFDGNARVEPPADPDYHFMTDMTDRAIGWMKAQQTMTPDKPFYVYFAPGAAHAPHHVPKSWIAKYKGKFDQGWDALRTETLERQKKLGLVPASTTLAPKPGAIKDWATLSDLEKKVFAHQAEVFAAFVEYTDHETGRLLAAIDALGERDNTLVVYVVGDNGTSAEGGPVGMFNESTYFNRVPEKLEDIAKKLDNWGDATTFPHMAAGWAVALNSPFSWTKQVASDFGGTRNGLVVRWPARIKQAGGVRTQFHHVIDVAPTVLEASTLPEPREVRGVPQEPLQGVSMAYSFDDAAAPSRHTTQYFEIGGNRALYHEGWLARTVHRAAWESAPSHPMKDDVWELFDTRSDFSLAHNVAAQHPDKLAELQARFMDEAQKNHVLPMDDRVMERFIPAVAGRPDLMAGRTSMTVYPGMVGMLENTFLNVKNTSFTITAELVNDGKPAHGSILVQGGRFGGWELYADKGKPAFSYNFLGLKRFTVQSKKALPKGKVSVKLDFAFDGKPGEGGTATLHVNGAQVAQGKIEHTQPFIFSADETADVGEDLGTPVVEAFAGERSRFTGATIESVTVQLLPQAAAAAAAPAAAAPAAPKAAQ